MNRIRKYNGVFQVLITPSIKISPDNSIMVGNWDDEELRNFYILEFDTLSDAQCEALKHPDIDWFRLTINHKHIFVRLDSAIRNIINDNGFTADIYSNLMDPKTIKDTMFERVMNGGERFNLRHGMNDIISFTIVNPWTNNLHKISKAIEQNRVHLYRDDLRIRDKRVIDGKIIFLYGMTEFGTVYEIKLVPTLLYHWGEWYQKYGYLKNNYARKLYADILKKQDDIDKLVIR